MRLPRDRVKVGREELGNVLEKDQHLRKKKEMLIRQNKNEPER